MRVHHGLGQVRAQLLITSMLLGAQLVLQKISRALNEFIEVGKLALWLASPRKAEETLHDFMAALRALANHLQIPFVLWIPVHFFQQLGKAHDRGKGIVKFVRHSGDKFADPRKLLALD